MLISNTGMQLFLVAKAGQVRMGNNRLSTILPIEDGLKGTMFTGYGITENYFKEV
ncbi:MAG: hypothetical protein ABUT20_49940 [Bacteroidota bacterium]